VPTEYHQMEGRRLSVSQGFEISMQSRGLRLKDIDVPLGQSMKSMIKNGQRRLPRDVAPKLARSMRHPAIVMAIAHELSGGYGSLWLNGPNVDSYRSSVKERAVMELQEAMDALHSFCSANPPETMTQPERRKLDSLLMELLDARQWVDFLTAVFCEAYGKDFLEVNEAHHQRLKSLRLVTD
jgi:hypothetical protein